MPNTMRPKAGPLSVLAGLSVQSLTNEVCSPA